jgi:hypothetical protein
MERPPGGEQIAKLAASAKYDPQIGALPATLLFPLAQARAGQGGLSEETIWSE